MNNLCWLRRDLRLHDHAALASALKSGKTTVVFIFDTHILDKLKNKNDRRLTFIYQSLVEIEEELQRYGSSLIILHGRPEVEIPKLANELKVGKVFCNRDYEPYAKTRDQKVEKNLNSLGISFLQFKDSVVFEKHEILNNSKEIYKVFTPYKNKWISNFEENNKQYESYECELQNLVKFKNKNNIINYNFYPDIGFKETLPPLSGGRSHALKRLEKFEDKISNYHHDRDFPSLEGTSLLSSYLRHGNISVREILHFSYNHSNQGSKIWTSEIVWRDFYQMILDVYPRVENTSFKLEYDQIKFPGSNEHFKLWCEGQTGFPIIDASMRCFNQTGLMHNRLRMITASFLCKTLLVDWRKGEKYFADNLLDFDLAANNGGWQWCSSSGCDSQPYFRIFNPYTQSKKFDSSGEFIRQWVKELSHLDSRDIHEPNKFIAPDYPSPIVNYETSRDKCMRVYSAIKSKA